MVCSSNFGQSQLQDKKIENSDEQVFYIKNCRIFLYAVFSEKCLDCNKRILFLKFENGQRKR